METMTEMALDFRPDLFDFHGVPMTHYFTDNWENVQNFQARPDDVLITTYPKAGSNWLSYLLDLLHFGRTSVEANVPIYLKVPTVELCFPSLPSEPIPKMYKGTEMVENLRNSPRLFKTHLQVNFLPKSIWEQNCRIIYMARNAKDSVVSYFHFERMMLTQPEPGDWSSYLQRFMQGKMVFGSWYDHVNDWWKKKQTYPNIHYMFYEDLVKDTGGEIDKLCSFLSLSPSEEQKKWIADKVHFDKMKKNEMVNYSTCPIMDNQVSAFIRKGKVGDWKNHFTVTQSEDFDEDYKEKMKDPTLQFHTEL